MTRFSLFLVLIVLLTFGLSSARQTDGCVADGQFGDRIPSNDKCDPSLDIRFVVVSNVLMSESSRHIEIFLDPEEYSEEKLKRLFETFSNWYPGPERLVIVVNTSWPQLPRLTSAPDCPGRGTTGARNDRDNENYSAYFSRRDEKTYFSYFENLDATEKMRTVVIDRKN